MFDDFEEIRRKIEKTREEILVKKAELKAATKELQKYNVSSLEEIQVLLKKRRKKLHAKAEEETARLKKFKKKYQDKLK